MEAGPAAGGADLPCDNARRRKYASSPDCGTGARGGVGSRYGSLTFGPVWIEDGGTLFEDAGANDDVGSGTDGTPGPDEDVEGLKP